MLPIKKIYIDSRQKTADPASDSDFSIDLQTTYLMPDDTGFYVEDVCLPVSWYTIETGKNDILFFEFEGILKQAFLKEGNYTTAEFATALNSALYTATSPSVIVGLNPFAVTYYKPTNAVIIQWNPNYVSVAGSGYTAGKTFFLPTDYEVSLRPAITAATRKRSINTLLKNFTQFQTYSVTTTFVSGNIGLHPLRNVYLSCTGLGNFSTTSLTGDRNIIKKIPINGQPGAIIYDSEQTGVDHLDCSRQTLSRISFQLKDNYGTIINLHGIHWSFSLVFSRIQNGI